MRFKLDDFKRGANLIVYIEWAADKALVEIPHFEKLFGS